MKKDAMYFYAVINDNNEIISLTKQIKQLIIVSNDIKSNEKSGRNKYKY